MKTRPFILLCTLFHVFTAAVSGCATAPERHPATVMHSPFETQTAMDRFAETGDTEDRVFHLWDLASTDPQGLERIYSHCLTPKLDDFRGNRFDGFVLYVKYWSVGRFSFNQYTGKTIDLVTEKFYSQPLTFQKRFFGTDNANGESGVNYWPVLKKVSMPMRIYVSEDLQGGKLPSLKIDYDVTANHSITERPLIDEIRQIPGSDLYLGKMYFRVNNKPVLFLWFALERSK